MNFKNNLLLLIISVIIFTFILYYFFIYDKKTYISDADAKGRISHDDDYWYYDKEWTCVNFVDNNSLEICDLNKGVCGSNLEDQKLLVKEAGRNKNKIHDRCPIIY